MTDAIEAINRIKRLHKYEVTVKINGDLNFSKQIPYDFRIDRGVATIYVYAETHEEANQKAMEFINVITS
jgi:hypothetical protein